MAIQDRQKCNEESKFALLGDLVRMKGKHAFSSIRDFYGYEKFTTEYQLRKALRELIEVGWIETDFKGHNRYGYTRYFATQKGIERVQNRAEAEKKIAEWIENAKHDSGVILHGEI
jgi:DNA-binding PadR family transcriptional regulator